MDLESLNVTQLDAWEVVFGSTRLVYGENALDRLGEMSNQLGVRRVLLVTDPGNRAAGHAARAVRSLARESIEVALFDDHVENPTTGQIEEGRRIAAEHEADCIVGLGGGSVMDCAKGVNFLLTNGGKMEDYQGYGKAEKPMLPSIGVPATAGTGSEAQSYALISREDSKVKMACGDAKARFHTVILDPRVAASVPRDVAATTGIDALSHAVESFVSTKRNPISQSLGKEAWRLLQGNLLRAISPETDLGSWGRMLVGSFLAGAAIEHSMLGATHACANPLTARFGVTHGKAVGLMLPHVMQFNSEVVSDLYGELLQAGSSRAATLNECVRELRAEAGLPRTLQECGIPADALPQLAKDAATQWTARFNPRPVAEKDLLGFYEAAY